ncbi:Complement C1q subcomponent subunit A [Bienertia sinuspersici]
MAKTRRQKNHKEPYTGEDGQSTPNDRKGNTSNPNPNANTVNNSRKGEGDDTNRDNDVEKPQQGESQIHENDKTNLNSWIEVMTGKGLTKQDHDITNRTETPMVTIDMDDIEDEITYWSSAMICFVLGANPPLPVMSGFCNRIWGKKGLDKDQQQLKVGPSFTKTADTEQKAEEKGQKDSQGFFPAQRKRIKPADQATPVQLMNGDSFFLTSIYGFNGKIEREPLWEGLQRLHSSIGNSPWCVTGDFNAVMNKQDRIGAVKKCQTKLHKEPHNTELAHKEYQANQQMKEANAQYYSWLQQKAKIHWLQVGDSNSKVFYNSLKVRTSRNNINRLMDSQGRWVEDMESITTAFTSSKNSQVKLAANVNTRDTDQEAVMLNTPFDGTDSSGMNENMVSTICQEVMKVVKRKQAESGNNSTTFVNFASKIVYSLRLRLI